MPGRWSRPAPTQRFEPGAERGAWVILVIVMLCWAGNVVASRMATGEISPGALVTLRWLLVCALLFAFAPRRTIEGFKLLRPHVGKIAWLGAVGFTLSNYSNFLGATYTTGINLAIIQGLQPVMVLVGARLIYGTRIGVLQVVGAAICISGILNLATKGHILALDTIALNIGDVLVFFGALFYVIYTLALRRKPDLPPFAFFNGIAVAALVSSLPVLGAEIATKSVIWPTWTGFWVLIYVSLFTSLIAQFLFIRAVEMIGAARASVVQNAVPALGALLAVFVLGETFAAYHLVSLALVIIGIFVSERLGR